jgi:glycosyltransferase 2 family protein
MTRKEGNSYKMTKKFTYWVNIVSLIAFGLFFFFIRTQIIDTFKKLPSLNLFALFLMIPFQVLSFYTVAKMYQSYFEAFGKKIDTKHLYKVSLEMNFVNQVFPTGGVGGISYLALRLKDNSIASGGGALAQLVRFFMTFIGYIVFMCIGLLVLVAGGRASSPAIFLSTLIIGLIVTMTALGIYIISSESRITSSLSFLPKAINWLQRSLHISRGKDLINMSKVTKICTELHADYDLIASNWRSMRKPLFWICGMLVCELATIYTVYVSFGRWINLGALVMGYAVANIAGAFSVLPGGAVLYEGLMTATMAPMGVASALVLPVTIVYRVVYMTLSLPIGYFFYRQVFQDNQETLPALVSRSARAARVEAAMESIKKDKGSDEVK